MTVSSILNTKSKLFSTFLSTSLMSLVFLSTAIAESQVTICRFSDYHPACFYHPGPCRDDPSSPECHCQQFEANGNCSGISGIAVSLSAGSFSSITFNSLQFGQRQMRCPGMNAKGPPSTVTLTSTSPTGFASGNATYVTNTGLSGGCHQ